MLYKQYGRIKKKKMSLPSFVFQKPKILMGVGELRRLWRRGEEYTEELYKKDLHDQIIMMVWSFTQSQKSSGP